MNNQPSKEREIDEEDSELGIDTIYTKSTSIKRHQTCSFDLSDKNLHLINTEQLSNIDSTLTVRRTSSFNIDRDFPKKLLPITDFVEKQVLGEGAFGRAIKVKHLKSGRFFVLKEVVSHSKENEESLIREVSLLRSLKHNNVLATVGWVLKDKSICLLTELMHGGSLQSKIMNFNEEICLNQKLLFLRDIAAGMNFLHEHSIMHRDLTSSNCLLRKNNTVVISDFGLSKMLYDDLETSKTPTYFRSSSTETISKGSRERSSSNIEADYSKKIRNFLSVGDMANENLSDDLIICQQLRKNRDNMKIRRKHTVVGNPFWMAPEMLAGKSYNCLIDLYSFGVIGCEITARVSANPDYLERNNKDMSVNFPAFLMKHKDGELSNCPEELLALVQKCCDPSPDYRPTFNTLLSWIEDILFRVSNNIHSKMRISVDID